jgi:hypothetical protein
VLETVDERRGGDHTPRPWRLPDGVIRSRVVADVPPCIASSRRQNRLRVKTNFSRRINPITPVKPSPQKYSCFFLSEFGVYSIRPASV